MKTLCLVLALLLAYTSVAHCVDGNTDKPTGAAPFLPWDRALERRGEPSKAIETPPNKRATEEKRKQEEAQRIQTAVDEQMQDALKVRLHYTEQSVNDLIQ